MTSNGDLLSAESLLFTLISFLYAQAYTEIMVSRSIRLQGRQPDDLEVERDRSRIRGARLRAWGLGGAALVVGLVFAPPAATLGWHFLHRLPDIRAFAHYNAVAVTLILVTLSCGVLAIFAGRTGLGLSETLKRLG